MAAAATDKVRKKKSLFQTTLNGGIGAGDASLILQSASGLPTDTGVTIVINRVDANGTATPSAMEVVTGVVSGSTVGSLVRAEDGTSAKSHANASVVEMVWDAETWNDFCDAYLSEHNQDGTHKSAAVATPTHAATSKATPVDADEVPIVDSAASNVLKKLTWANIKATLKTYLTSEAFSFVTGVKDFASGILTATSPTLTTPVINTSISGTAIASGAEVTTGTDDTQIVTPKSLGDADVNTRLKSKVIAGTRAYTASAGSVAYTGVGFKPTSLHVVYGISGSGTVGDGKGFADSALGGGCINNRQNNGTANIRANFIYSDVAAGALISADVASYDSDGFTLTWSKTGSPTGTMAFEVIAYK